MSLSMSTPNTLEICLAIMGNRSADFVASSHMMPWMSSWDWPLGLGLPFFRAENSKRYLRFWSALWSFSSDDGLVIIAARRI